MPRLHAIKSRDKQTHRINKLTLFGAPIAPTASELMIEIGVGTEELKLTFKQAPDARPSYWKPGEMEIGIEAVRALRDACIEFLDRWHDESER